MTLLSYVSFFGRLELVQYFVKNGALVSKVALTDLERQSGLLDRRSTLMLRHR